MQRPSLGLSGRVPSGPRHEVPKKGEYVVWTKPMSGGADTVAAMLQPSEIVVPVKYAAKVERMMEAEGMHLPGFSEDEGPVGLAKGGRVRQKQRQKQRQRQTVNVVVNVGRPPARRRAAPPRRPATGPAHPPRPPHWPQAFGAPLITRQTYDNPFRSQLVQARPQTVTSAAFGPVPVVTAQDRAGVEVGNGLRTSVEGTRGSSVPSLVFESAAGGALSEAPAPEGVLPAVDDMPLGASAARSESGVRLSPGSFRPLGAGGDEGAALVRPQRQGVAQFWDEPSPFRAPTEQETQAPPPPMTPLSLANLRGAADVQNVSLRGPFSVGVELGPTGDLFLRSLGRPPESAGAGRSPSRERSGSRIPVRRSLLAAPAEEEKQGEQFAEERQPSRELSEPLVAPPPRAPTGTHLDIIAEALPTLEAKRNFVIYLQSVGQSLGRLPPIETIDEVDLNRALHNKFDGYTAALRGLLAEYQSIPPVTPQGPLPSEPGLRRLASQAGGVMFLPEAEALSLPDLRKLVTYVKGQTKKEAPRSSSWTKPALMAWLRDNFSEGGGRASSQLRTLFTKWPR